MAVKPKNKQNPVERLLASIDAYQRAHRFAGFPFAVIKKYGDDESGYQAALVTYYAFLSLFPLLIVATAVIGLVSQNNQALRERLISSLDNYFPAIGNQLQTNVHSSKATGVALVVGLLFALYGAKGSADAVRHALDHAWEVPRVKRPGFPKNTLKSLGLMVGGGIGLIVSATLTGLATSTFDHEWYLRILPILLGIGVNYLVFLFVFRIATATKHKIADIRLGALIAAIALLVLQTAGTYLVSHQLHNVKSTNAQFAVVLALLFWIYLQAQVFMYTVQINVVHTLKLWPRSLTGKDLTDADEEAFALYAKRETQKSPTEKVNVAFETKQ